MYSGKLISLITGIMIISLVLFGLTGQGYSFTLFYSTYLGGSDEDEILAMNVDSAGNVYITGGTYSDDFPTLDTLVFGSYRGTVIVGSKDIFLTKIKNTGGEIIFSTYLGGSDSDKARGVTVDSSGNVVITGRTYSMDYPTLSPIVLGSYRGDHLEGTSADVFVTKLNSDGNAIIFSTYLGGTEYETTYDIALDSSNRIYLTGSTESLDFPTWKSVTHTTYNGSILGGGYDGFVTRLGPGGSTILYSTYLGGERNDECRGIAVDATGNAYLTGFTTSYQFPTLNSIINKTYRGDHFSGAGTVGYGDVFITRLTTPGTAFVYSTYCGGSSDEIGRDIVVDSTGNSYVTGDSMSSDFPTAAPLVLGPYSGGIYSGGGFDGYGDAILCKLSSSGNTLDFSTFLGGISDDTVRGLTRDTAGNIFLAGATMSSNFPTIKSISHGSISGAYFKGVYDTFIVALPPAADTILYSTYLGGVDYDFPVDIAADASGYAYVVGETVSTNFPVLNPIILGSYRGDHLEGDVDVFIARLLPSELHVPVLSSAGPFLILLACLMAVITLYMAKQT